MEPLRATVFGSEGPADSWLTRKFLWFLQAIFFFLQDSHILLILGCKGAPWGESKGPCGLLRLVLSGPLSLRSCFFSP